MGGARLVSHLLASPWSVTSTLSSLCVLCDLCGELARLTQDAIPLRPVVRHLLRRRHLREVGLAVGALLCGRRLLLLAIRGTVTCTGGVCLGGGRYADDLAVAVVA